MRIKVLGDVSDALKELGVEGMSISNSEVYVGLQKGILDGVIRLIETLEVLKLAEVAKYVTMINYYRTHMGHRMMNLNKWNSLPPDIKKVFENNIEYYGQETEVRIRARRNQHAMDAGKKLGVRIHTYLKGRDRQSSMRQLRQWPRKKRRSSMQRAFPGQKYSMKHSVSSTCTASNFREARIWKRKA